MAVIGRIRKHYWLLVVIIGVALLLFVLSDFSRKRSKQPNNVGVIAGEKISLTEFNKRVDESTQIQKANSGKENLTAEETFQLRQSTWTQLLNEILMQIQYDKLGIKVSSDELNDLVRGNNPHPYILQSFTDPNTGKFDKKAVDNFLTNLDNVDPAMKFRYLMMEKAIKQDRLMNKYNSLITKGFYVPTAFAKNSYTENSRLAQVRIAGIRYNSINDSLVSINDDDFRKYYEENKYRYIQDKPLCTIDYIVFENAPSADDMLKLREDMNKLFEEFKTIVDVPAFVSQVSDSRYDSTWKKRGSYGPREDSLLFAAPVGTIFPPLQEEKAFRIYKVMDRQIKPDSLRASHILISYTGTQVRGVTRSMDAARSLADSLFNVVKANPASLESLATVLSDDESSKVKQGDLGWFADGAMVAPFNKAVAEGAIGSVAKVESQFGFHIIKVTGKKDPSVKIRVATVDRYIEPSAKTVEKNYNDASAFAAEFNTMEKFEKAAKDKGLNVRQFDKLSTTDGSLPGIQQARGIVQWAFYKDTKPGDVKFFETENGYAVATLKNVIPKGTVPFDIMKDQIKPLVTREKKAEFIIKKVNNQFAKLKDINSLIEQYQTRIDTAEVSFANANLPNYGNEPALTGRIFAAKPGTLSAPVKGEQGVYVFILDSIKEPPAAEDMNSQKKQQAMFFQGRVNMIPMLLEQKAKIKDNRTLFY